MVLAIVNAANISRVGKKLISGYPTMKVQLYFILLTIFALVVWSVQAFMGMHALFIVFTALGLNLFMNPSVLGEKGLKLGVRYVPKERIVDYTVESMGKTKWMILFRVEGNTKPLEMVVDEKRNKDLLHKLSLYFGGTSLSE
jgi:hypothetical protein